MPNTKTVIKNHNKKSKTNMLLKGGECRAENVIYHTTKKIVHQKYTSD